MEVRELEELSRFSASVAEAAELFGVSKERMRKLVKRGELPEGTYVSFLGRIGIDLGALQSSGWEPPAPAHGGPRQRPDGRKLYKVYLTDEEVEAVKNACPGAIFKPKKAKKAKAEAEEASTPEGEAPTPEDPFEAFGL